MLALIGPLSLEEMAAAAAAVLLPVLITWLVMGGKLKRVQRESSATLEQLRTESGAALQAAQAKAAAEAAESAQNSAAAATSFADLQQRFSTHREVAERRANDASQQITRLAGGRLRQSHERLSLSDIVLDVLNSQAIAFRARGLEVRHHIKPIEVIVDPGLLSSLVGVAVDWAA